MYVARVVALLVFTTIFTTHAFYLPGVAPREYDNGESIDLKVNKLMSIHTQVPYSFYSLPYCAPDRIEDARENLGEMLLGDRIENSVYEINALEASTCKILCEKEYDNDQIKEFVEKIKQEYRGYWIVDNLPAATKKTLVDNSGKTQEIYEAGFPVGDLIVGDQDETLPILNNHVNMKFMVHQNPAKFTGVRLVGFEVLAASIDHYSEEATSDCDATYSDNLLFLDDKAEKTKVKWTYSIEWEYSDVPWAARWDIYFKMVDDQIHWFSIINSMMVVLFLSGMVAMIMMRALHRDIGQYKETENSEDPTDDTGWKLVHGDVFRPPSNPMMLAVSIGTGVQTLTVVVVTMIFAVLGFLSPANRGGLMTAMVVLLVLMGIFAGYFSARSYKMFKGKQWKKATLMTAFLYPGVMFVVFFILNLCLAGERSSGAVPWYICLELGALWLFIYVPLTFMGVYFGFRKPIVDPPLRVNQIPRQIPEQVWYLRPTFSVLMGGILPFGAIFIELFFMLSSIWLHQFYYLFGFLFVVFVILAITCAEITIVMCYFQLCAEDYHWWWRSFLTSGASSFYMFLYSIFYLLTRLEITSFVSFLLYFGYTFIMTTYFFTMTGAIGFYACKWFVTKIYSEIHVD